MITEKTKYYLTLNGYRALTKFRETSKRQFDAYNYHTKLQYQIWNLLVGNQKGSTRSEIYSSLSFFSKDDIKEALMKMRKAGYITTVSGVGVKPKRKYASSRPKR